MGVSLVYLGINDDAKQEMKKMCEAIAGKLRRAGVDQVQQTNLANGKNLPLPNSVTQDEVWFCGHSRFVEANRSIRKISDRNLGGFPIDEIAEFTKSCLTRGRKKIRLICCESAQQQRYQPKKVGKPAAGFDRVLGNELLQTVTNPQLLDQFDPDIDSRVSHLEGLIFAMAELWQQEKKTKQPEFAISGLWGAGDITDDNVPISSFLQNDGSLEAQGKLDDPDVKGPKRDRFAATFENAHCKNQGLPDFFGYRIRDDLFREWQPGQAHQALHRRHLGRTGRQRARLKGAAAWQ
jgi:hypothetical protein